MFMTPEDARFWLDVIAIVAAVLWLAGAWFVAASARRVTAPATGELDVDSDPEAFVTRARELLMRGVANSPLSRLKIVEATDLTLSWQGSGAGVRHAGSLRATRRGKGTRIEWQVEADSGLLTAGRWVVAVGALTIAGLYWLLAQYVVASEQPGLRFQVVQMCQAVHVLWPPFLFGGLPRGIKRRLVTDLDQSLSNLRFDP